MLIIAGTLTITAGERDHYLERCHGIVARARSAEGCLDFSLAADLIDPDRITVYERWASDDDLQRFRAAAGDDGPTAGIEHAEVARYLIAEVGPA
jgi:quinol monooxygenase YgiN